MDHLGAEEAGPHFAESAHEQSFVRRALELLQLAAVEIEEAQHQALGVHDELALRAVFDLGIQHARLDQHGRAGRRRSAA